MRWVNDERFASKGLWGCCEIVNAWRCAWRAFQETEVHRTPWECDGEEATPVTERALQSGTEYPYLA